MFKSCYPPNGLALLVGLFLVPAGAEVCTAQKPNPGDLPNRILVLDGSPVHDVGELWSHVSNWGAIGSMPGAGQPFSNAPSAEWPGGSKVEYLWVSGLWVAALVNGVPAVSTAAYQIEFRPSSSPLDIVYESQFGATGGNRIPSPSADDDNDGSLNEDVLDGFDNDLDGLVDEDYAAISDQMLSRRFRDDDPSVPSPPHNPQHLAVHKESYQFEDDDFDDFVGFTLTIKNDGNETLEDVYIGLFADGDVGHRDTPNYWEDDAAKFANDLVVDHGAHGSQAYDFAYWYDVDGDGGQASGYCGFVILDHPHDPDSLETPYGVGARTYANFSGNVAYEDGGDPTNDFERYELMSSHILERDATIPRDYRTMVSIGPFDEIQPGQTIEFSFALVVTPRDDFSNVQKAALAYHGQWFDLDNNPATGIDGKEHQEHWYLPTDNPVPVAISNFHAEPVGTGAVRIAWDIAADEAIASFELLRSAGGGQLRSLASGLQQSAREFLDAKVTPGTRYEYVLVAHAESGAQFRSPQATVNVPGAMLSLHQNVPNPFTASTHIGVTLTERADMTVSVYDVAGRHVATIARGARDAGEHDFQWNGTDDAGNRVGAGVYFYKLAAGKQALTKKLVLMR